MSPNPSLAEALCRTHNDHPPDAIPGASDPRNRVAACYECQRRAESLAPFIADLEREAVQEFLRKRDRPVIKVETAGEAEFMIDPLTNRIKVLEAENERLRETGPVAVHVTCPECGEHLPVSATTHIDTSEAGGQELRIEPDLADVWAHHFTHEADSEKE